MGLTERRRGRGRGCRRRCGRGRGRGRGHKAEVLVPKLVCATPYKALRNPIN